MKTKIIIISGILIVLILILVGGQINKRSAMSKSLVIEPVGEKGVFVGDSKLLPNDENEKRHRLYSVQQKRWEEHQKTLKGIDKAWDYIGIGAKHFKTGEFEKAAESYEKSYVADPGSRHVSGQNLARTYEKLGRYDEGVKLLNQMINNKEMNEFGMKIARAHIARLEALKAGRSVPEDKDPTNPVPNLDPSSYVFSNKES